MPPQYEVVKCGIVELDTNAILRDRLTTLQRTIESSLAQRVVDNYNEGIIAARSSANACVLQRRSKRSNFGGR
jgi:hypothetical protein